MNIVLTNAAQSFGIGDLSSAGLSLNFGARLYRTNTADDPGTVAVGQILGLVAGYAKGVTYHLDLYKTGTDLYTVRGYSLTLTDGGQPLLTLGSDRTTGGVALARAVTATAMFNGDDIFIGNDFDNVFEGLGGNDRMDGGGGTDTAVFHGLRSQHTVTRTDAHSLTVAGYDGTASLIDMERLQFSDATVAYDTAGNAGQAFRLYQAAFNRAPDPAGLGVQVHTLDRGTSLTQLAANFIASGEFSASYGALGNTAFVLQLYTNVLHRAPDTAGMVYQVGQLDAGLPRAALLANFSESAENQANLVGVTSNGIVFTG